MYTFKDQPVVKRAAERQKDRVKPESEWIRREKPRSIPSSPTNNPSSLHLLRPQNQVTPNTEQSEQIKKKAEAEAEAEAVV